MNDELKQLIQNAAKLLHFQYVEQRACFNPLDPERGDLMRVAEAAGLVVNFDAGIVSGVLPLYFAPYKKGDHQSLALAVLRAASAVMKARES